MKRLIPMCFAAILCGCMTLGKPFEVAPVPSIELGKTTDKDLNRMFGEPYRTGIEDGSNTATWLHYKLSVFGDQRTRDLYVKFNSDGTVKSYAFNSNIPADQVQIKKITSTGLVPPIGYRLP